MAFSLWVCSSLWAPFEINVQEVRNVYHLFWKTSFYSWQEKSFYSVITHLEYVCSSFVPPSLWQIMGNYVFSKSQSTHNIEEILFSGLQVLTAILWNIIPSHKTSCCQDFWASHQFVIIIYSRIEHHINLFLYTAKRGAAGGWLQPWNDEEVQVSNRFWAAQRERCESSASAQWPSCPQSDLDHFPSISRMLRARTLSGLQSEVWKRRG